MAGLERCPCGRPLHYSNVRSRRAVERLIDEHGPLQNVTVSGSGTWRIPRHYIALHGLVGYQVHEVAAELGFEKVA